MIHDDSSDDLRTKSKRALKAILAKCTHLQVRRMPNIMYGAGTTKNNMARREEGGHTERTEVFMAYVHVGSREKRARGWERKGYQTARRRAGTR